MKQRRSVRQWIAGILKLQPHLDEQERHSLIETGIRLGVALATQKPAHESYKGYGRLVSEQATGAQVQLLAPPPSAVYEPPDKQTGPMRPVNPELAKWGVNTASLPAYPGQWMRLRKQNGKLPKP